MQFLDTLLPNTGDETFAVFADLVIGLFMYEHDKLHILLKINKQTNRNLCKKKRILLRILKGSK